MPVVVEDISTPTDLYLRTLDESVPAESIEQSDQERFERPEVASFPTVRLPQSSTPLMRMGEVDQTRNLNLDSHMKPLNSSYEAFPQPTNIPHSAPHTVSSPSKSDKEQKKSNAIDHDDLGPTYSEVVGVLKALQPAASVPIPVAKDKVLRKMDGGDANLTPPQRLRSKSSKSKPKTKIALPTILKTGSVNAGVVPQTVASQGSSSSHDDMTTTPVEDGSTMPTTYAQSTVSEGESENKRSASAIQQQRTERMLQHASQVSEQLIQSGKSPRKDKAISGNRNEEAEKKVESQQNRNEQPPKPLTSVVPAIPNLNLSQTDGQRPRQSELASILTKKLGDTAISKSYAVLGTHMDTHLQKDIQMKDDSTEEPIMTKIASKEHRSSHASSSDDTLLDSFQPPHQEASPTTAPLSLAPTDKAEKKRRANQNKKIRKKEKKALENEAKAKKALEIEALEIEAISATCPTSWEEYFASELDRPIRIGRTHKSTQGRWSRSLFTSPNFLARVIHAFL